NYKTGKGQTAPKIEPCPQSSPTAPGARWPGWTPGAVHTSVVPATRRVRTMAVHASSRFDADQQQHVEQIHPTAHQEVRSSSLRPPTIFQASLAKPGVVKPAIAPEQGTTRRSGNLV